MHKTKLVNWLQANDNNKLVVLAYNDSVVIYNGKPLVSATGGNLVQKPHECKGILQQHLNLPLQQIQHLLCIKPYMKE